MSQIRLVADSSCDLLSLDGVDFVSVPLTLRTETEEFRDDARLDVDAMVSTLRATKGRSYSACPNVADWEKAFGESGDVLAFTITSSLSGSYGAACVAKQSCEERDPSRRIRVVDTLSAGPETMLLLEKAASAQRGGASFDEVCRVVERLHLPVVHNPCPANGYSRRQEVKELIASLETRYPDIKQKLFGSMQRYPLYGWNLHAEER